MCFNPGDGEVVLESYAMEELANALNERFVTAGLDRVVPKKTHAVHTGSDTGWILTSVTEVKRVIFAIHLSAMYNLHFSPLRRYHYLYYYIRSLNQPLYWRWCSL